MERLHKVLAFMKNHTRLQQYNQKLDNPVAMKRKGLSFAMTNCIAMQSRKKAPIDDARYGLLTLTFTQSSRTT